MSGEPIELLTCGDNSCLLDKPSGQGTNGGCRCINSRMTTSEILRVRKYIHRLKQENARLKKQDDHMRGIVGRRFQ